MTEIWLKHPNEDGDFSMELDDLGSTTASSVSFTMPTGSGLTKVSEGISGTSPQYATVRVSGGNPGVYQLLAAVTLANGRTLPRSGTMRITAAV